MTGFIGVDEVQRIKAANDLVQVMSDYAPPQRAGHDYVVCCPFHQERTPSCHLYVGQQTYHCFGCGAHGDVISLIREKEGLDFADAVELLARRSGLEVRFERVGRSSLQRGERDALRQVMALAVAFYERLLWDDAGGDEARAYLAQRGLSPELCRRFHLGWAPGRGLLLEEARRRGVEPSALRQLDLAIERDDGRLADRFFERLMFPICDRFGSPIAFSGRLLPAAERRAKEAGRPVGKYVNNTDTPLYHKSNVVYNLHQARAFCRDAGRIIVMEGPTDVMAADQAGIGECVAVMGTALTDEHARQLGSVVGTSGRVLLLFDGDEAGRTKVLKAVQTCIAASVPSRVVLIPDERDPAEILTGAGGIASFDAILGTSVADIDHLLRSLAPRPHQLEHRQRLAVLDEILAGLRRISDRDLAAAYLADLAAYFRVETGRLERRLREGAAAPPPAPPPADDGASSAPLDTLHELVLQILVREPELREPALEQWGCEPCFFGDPWRFLIDIFLEDPAIDTDRILLAEEVVRFPILYRMVHRWLRSSQGPGGQDLSDPARILQDTLRALRRQEQAQRCQELQDRLLQAQRDGRLDEAATLFAQVMDLRRESGADA
jgi:DNA primase